MKKILIKDVHYSNWVVYMGKPVRIGLTSMPQAAYDFFYVPFTERIIDRCDNFIKVNKRVYIFEQGKYTLFINGDGTAAVYLTEGMVFLSNLNGISDMQNLYPFLSGRDTLDITVKTNDLNLEYV